MSKSVHQFGVPVGSFALALLLAWAAGPSPNAGHLRAAQSTTGSCSVKIKGEKEICGETPETFTAEGVPPNGNCSWELINSPGVTIVSTANCSVTIQADSTATEFTLKVEYTAEGKTCKDRLRGTVLELIKIPVCVRLLKNSDGTNGTSVKAEDVQAKIDKANEIWKHCCIRFELAKDASGHPEIDGVNTPQNQDRLAESIHVRREANGSSSPGFEKVNRIGHHDEKCINVMFVKAFDRSQGFTIPPTYPDDRTQPPTGLQGAGTGVDDAANANTLAHELGHQLGLGHANNPRNLMSEGASGTALSEDQCAFARESAKLLLQALGN